MSRTSLLPNGCVEYTGYRRRDGYGELSLDTTRRKVRAHRFVWEALVGPIPDGMVVCHSCDNPPCIRIDHLFLGTQQDNIEDMNQKGRHNPKPRRTHCKYGHPMNEATTYANPNGGRTCKRCAREKPWLQAPPA